MYIFEEFCQYNDYNWDWSLNYINEKCMQQRLYVVFPQSPTVFHIDDCSVHNRKCQIDKSYQNVQNILEINVYFYNNYM